MPLEASGCLNLEYSKTEDEEFQSVLNECTQEFATLDADMTNIRVFKFRANNEPESPQFGCTTSSPCRLCAHAIDDHLNGVLFNNSGVYIYEKSSHRDIPSSFYAGQARHFASRTDNNSRLADVDYVYLIGLVNIETHPDKCRKMDENWRQHFEHKLIDHLYDSCISKRFVVDNHKREGHSFASISQKESMDASFDLLKTALDRLHCYPFTAELPSSANQDLVGVRARSSPGATKNVYHVEGKYDPRTKALEVFERCEKDQTAFVSIGRWQVAMTYQQAKTSLIDAGYIKPGLACSPGGKKERNVYLLTQKLTFANISEAVHVVANAPKAARDVFERLDEKGNWVPFDFDA